ncbi:carbon-nitrogen hydrolase family protein [Amycolatopsis sp.]|uniref:carbon-nitrogen hydrolase family protein n=1 Tax=Amycolatopsis sp. TaxID=37632 RepID=UPI002C11E86B|nr:carbon-nitrogen hydrolase family protein [Amycolatopsis sp.]HVV10947.1 carbon-nitrogen hydrolase family protein [Amycolatopsis sp.]
MATLTVATCQFPVSADIRRNARYVRRQLRFAHEHGADVAHFPEACLSGYAGSDFSDYQGFDWSLLESVTCEILGLVARLGIWAVLGSTHPLTGKHKPHNSLYVVDSCGAIVDRYDKRFCAGGPDERSGDLAHYTPGDHATVFTINGIRCGALICHDFRYPELYRDYKRKEVQLVFHSYHAAHMSPETFAAVRAQVGDDLQRLNPGGTYPGITQPSTMTAAAAANHLWISCPNSSARESCWGAFFLRADGVVTGRLPRNRAGVLISVIDTEAPLYDSTAAWRSRAMNGILHSGTLVDDARSRRRTEL